MASFRIRSDFRESLFQDFTLRVEGLLSRWWDRGFAKGQREGLESAEERSRHEADFASMIPTRPWIALGVMDIG
jgi:hypothetical protein